MPGPAALAIVITALTLAVPRPAGAQEAAPERGARPAIRPFELLLEQQAALGLTPDQLAGLERIRQRLTSANTPLVARMLALRREWRQAGRAEQLEGDADRLERIRLAAESINARIRRNNQMAMRAANRLLTADQRAQLRSIIQERRKQGAGPKPPGVDPDAGLHH
jgi:hypothetical protein